jgi:hypothetical protein
MKLKIRGTGEGAVLDIIEPGQGSGVEDSVVTSIAVPSGKELNVNLPTATVLEQIEYGDVVDTPAPTPEAPVDQPGGGEEGSPAGGGEPPAGEQGGGEQPAEGEAGGTPEGQPTTSEASEKPLYLVDGDTIPEGFTESGLETPDGKTLFHFGSDTAGQSATGNADGVSVYADADDNEKPVQAVTPAEPSA